MGRTEETKKEPKKEVRKEVGENRGDGWRWRYWYAYGDLFQDEQDEGYEVVMLDNLSHGAPNTTSAQDTFFSQYPCDRLMHFAALTHVRKSAWNWTVQNDSPRDLVEQGK